MALLTIPKRQYAVLRKLSELSDPQFAELVKCLNEIEASLSAQEFSKHLSEKIPAIPPDVIADLIRMLCGLYPAKEYNNKTASQIAADIKATAEEDKPTNFPLDGINVVQSRLETLLSIDKTLAITAKAHDVVTEHEHNFCAARIFSDVRPIFSAAADAVSAAVVVHTLNVSYHKSGEHKEFYIAMDNADIKILKKVIERAEKKGAVLQSLIRKSGITYLEEGD